MQTQKWDSLINLTPSLVYSVQKVIYTKTLDQNILIEQSFAPDKTIRCTVAAEMNFVFFQLSRSLLTVIVCPSIVIQNIISIF